MAADAAVLLRSRPVFIFSPRHFIRQPQHHLPPCISRLIYSDMLIFFDFADFLAIRLTAAGNRICSTLVCIAINFPQYKCVDKCNALTILLSSVFYHGRHGGIMGVYRTVLTITVNGAQTLLPAEPAGVEITGFHCDDADDDRVLQWLLQRNAVADDGTIDEVELPTIYDRLADHFEYVINLL